MALNSSKNILKHICLYIYICYIYIYISLSIYIYIYIYTILASTQTQISITAMDACMLQAADVLFFKDLKTPSHTKSGMQGTTDIAVIIPIHMERVGASSFLHSNEKLALGAKCPGENHTLCHQHSKPAPYYEAFVRQCC